MISDNVRQLRRPSAKAGRRVVVNWAAEVKLQDGPRRPCTILDISKTGARVRLDSVPATLGPVWLLVDDIGPISGTLVWRRRGSIGIRFREDQYWVARSEAQRFDSTAWLYGTKEL